MNQIVSISIEKLHQHPDNPRKDVGDVTELANSIRHSGVMQNLTVVPYEGGYRVVIGHRRLAAAKAAGLTELPCKVVEMDEKEQLATMVAENMQRVDLTVPEQVHGIQMMLDIGNTPEQVMKTTGLSRTTFYHRKAMAALPQDELQKSWERGGTLADYIALEQIKDKDLKKEVLKTVGTNNFQYKLQSAVKEEAYQKQLEEVLLLLEPVARRVTTEPRGRWKHYICFSNEDNMAKVRRAKKEIEADSEGEYVFFIGKQSWDRDVLKTYCLNEKPVAKSAGEIEREQKERERKQRVKSLKELHESFSDLRKGFIGSFRETDKTVNSILQTFLIRGGAYIDELDIMRDVFSGEGDAKALKEAYCVICKATPGAVMLAAMELECEDCADRYGCYNEPREDTRAYLRLLESLGYAMSDEEKAYWNGTHELFLKEDDA